MALAVFFLKCFLVTASQSDVQNPLKKMPSAAVFTKRLQEKSCGHIVEKTGLLAQLGDKHLYLEQVMRIVGCAINQYVFDNKQLHRDVLALLQDAQATKRIVLEALLKDDEKALKKTLSALSVKS